jgi:hypothetical protein
MDESLLWVLGGITGYFAIALVFGGPVGAISVISGFIFYVYHMAP